MTCTARCLVLIILLFLVGIPIQTASAIPPFGIYSGATYSPNIAVEQLSETSLRLNLTMPSLPDTGTLNLGSRLPGLWEEMNPTGHLLPRISILVAVPATGAAALTIEGWQSRVFSVVPPRNLPENNPAPARVTLGEIGILGGTRIMPVTFRPIQYVNSASACSVVYQASIRIDFSGTGPNPVTDPRPGFSRSWQKVFKSVVLNWEQIPNIDHTLPSHMLMIVPQNTGVDFVPLVQEFVHWKEQQGIKVTVLPTSAFTGNLTSPVLRSRIIDSVRTAHPVDYVLFVGDESLIPIQTTTTSDPTTRFSTESFGGSYTNEGFYAGLEGLDVYPDVFVGRWAVNLDEEVLNHVRRVLVHERETFALDSARFSAALFGADTEEPSQRQTKRDVRQMLLRQGVASVDTLWGQGLSPWLTINRINAGRMFLNYRGRGWGDGWTGLNFYDENIADLNNLGKLPIVTGIGCGVAIFTNWGQGFGEAWMLAGSTTEPAGAAGFIGPCWNTHTIYNDCLDSLLYRAWFEHGVPQLMPGLVAGKMMTLTMMAQFMNESSVAEVVRTMFRQYMVHGDPSLRVYTRMPYRLDVSVPGTLPVSDGVIPVTVSNVAGSPADSLNVTLWRGPGDFETHWLSGGITSVDFAFSPGDADTVIVTVTGDNILSFQKRIPERPSATDPEIEPALPVKLDLQQNYPNPFNAQTQISFSLPRIMRARLEIFDMLGRSVTELVDDDLAAGSHTFFWNAAEAGSGLYFYRLTTPEGVLARKMILIR